MRIVIQCAGTKRADAGSLWTADGRRVHFVAHPTELGKEDGTLQARPDDVSPDGRTWRQRLLAYNQAGSNPHRLLPAVRLYSPKEYKRLGDWIGCSRLFILSAGWGLVPAAFLLPLYDITFSSSAPASLRRRASDDFDDWSLMDSGNDGPVLFLGGKDYLPLFEKLTRSWRGPRIALYRSSRRPSLAGVKFIQYQTPRRTNWHYEAANALVDGKLRVSELDGEV